MLTKSENHKMKLVFYLLFTLFSAFLYMLSLNVKNQLNFQNKKTGIATLSQRHKGGWVKIIYYFAGYEANRFDGSGFIMVFFPGRGPA